MLPSKVCSDMVACIATASQRLCESVPPCLPSLRRTRMEYKYVIKDEEGRVVRWQEGDNVVLELPPSARSIALEVEDAWNHEKQVKRVLAAGTPVKFNLQKQCAWGQQVRGARGRAWSQEGINTVWAVLRSLCAGKGVTTSAWTCCHAAILQVHLMLKRRCNQVCLS